MTEITRVTWIIAFPSIGYASAVADIQVTYRDDTGNTRYLDCLQKVYPVGRWILAGFCGSVRIGFRLMDDLRAWLRFPDNEPDLAWIPEFVALKWRRRARRIFAALDPEYPGGSAIVLAGVHPKQNASLLEWGPSHPVSYACVMRAPEYLPERISEGKVASIGSGNDIEKYRAKIEHLNRHPVDLMWGDLMNEPGMSASILAHTLGLDVQKTPAPGVSKHFHLGIVRRGEITIEPNDWWISGRWSGSVAPTTTSQPDDGREVIRAPACATDWDSLQHLLRQAGVTAINAAQA